MLLTPGPNSTSRNKLTNGIDDAPDLFKLSANCPFVFTRNIWSISLFFIAYFNALMYICKHFSVTYVFETKGSQSDLLSVMQCIGIACSDLS